MLRYSAKSRGGGHPVALQPVRAFAVCGMLVVAVGACEATSEDSIRSQATCNACRITVQHIATIGDSSGPGILTGPPLQVAAVGSKGYVVFDGEVPKLFGVSGSFIRTIGRKGQGPGEVIPPVLPIPIPGDSLLVLQPLRGRATVYSPNYEYVREVKLPGQFGRYLEPWVWPDSVLMVGTVHTPQSYGYPLHLISLSGSEGSVIASGGPDEVRVDERGYVAGFASGRSTWLVKNGTYVLQRWGNDLNLLETIQRTPEWWSKEYLPGGNASTPPSSVVERVLADGDLLWVFVRIPNRRWREAWPAGTPTLDSTGHIRGEQEAPDFGKLYSTLVEVVDPTRRAVITRARFSYPILHLMERRRAAAYIPRRDGTPQIHVLQFNLTQ